MGLPRYPVFTHKHHTDISYLACARALLRAPRRDLPAVRHAQRRHHRRDPADGARGASSNAAPARHGRRGVRELQRLHGMGEGIYREVLEGRPGIAGAASTRRWASTATCSPTWCAGCWRTAPTRPSCTSWPTNRSSWTSCCSRRCAPQPAPSLPLPPDAVRRAAQEQHGRRPRRAAHARAAAGAPGTACSVAGRAGGRRRGRRRRDGAPAAAFPAWRATPVAERAGMLRRAADALEAQLPRAVRAAGEGSATRPGATAWPRCARRSTSALLRRRGRAHPAAGRAARPHRREQRAAPARRAASSSASARGISRSRSSPARSRRRW